jgi:uncharacterized protein
MEMMVQQANQVQTNEQNEHESCESLLASFNEQPIYYKHDDVYGQISLGAREEKLVHTPEFLRLQHVKQLGFVYHVWPGATHTRYEHSLGCYHLTKRVVRLLSQRGGHQGGIDGIPTSSVQALMVAALLHDIGHYPYSHTIEELGYPILLHEQIGRRIIEHSEIATILERDYHLSPQRVADFIDPPKNRSRHPVDQLLSQLLSGALDIDKLDYLPRDARACNVSYGVVDVAALLDALRVYPLSSGMPPVALTRQAVNPLYTFLHARQAMYLNVYWHPVNRAYNAMLVRAVQDALCVGALRAEQIVGKDDAKLLAMLSEPHMPASSRQLIRNLTSHQPYEIVLEVSHGAGQFIQHLANLTEDAQRRRHIEHLLQRSPQVLTHVRK